MLSPVRPLHQDPFAPVLYDSEVLEVSEEQQNYIKEILRTASSDSRFAQKAYASIILVLTAGRSVLPELESISPASAKIGDPSFTLSVHGKNFDAGSVIVWNGGVENTEFVNDTELKTTVNMDTATTAAVIPVAVQNSNAVVSNYKAFDLQPATQPTAIEAQAVKDQIKLIETPVRARTEVSKQAGEFPNKPATPILNPMTTKK